MHRGIVAALYGNHGQIICGDRAYNFSTDQVQGGIRNHQEVDFEYTDSGDKIKVIYGTGANKPTNKPKPTKKKENTTSKLVDNRELLTEEK